MKSLILSQEMLQMMMCLRRQICTLEVWDKEKVLDELRYYKMNDQICIVNQETLNQLITLKKSYEVKDDSR